MKEKPKSDAELQQEILVSQKRIIEMMEEAKSYRRKPVNVWGIVLILGGVYAAYGFQLYHSRQPWHKVFWILLPGVLLLVGCGVSWVVERRKAKAKADWYRNVEALVDTKGFDGYDCLYYNLEPDQRQRLLQELEGMPQVSRTLRKAVQIVCPDFIDDDDAA